MLPIPATAMIPPGSGNTMEYIGIYTYAQFASAPLMAGDLAVYFSTFPGDTPTGGSGADWAALGNGGSIHATFIASKVIEAGDIGVSPTSNQPAHASGSRFVIYRGPGSILLRLNGAGVNVSYTKNVKHCGMFMVVEQQPGKTYIPTTPAAWNLRRTQSVTWGGTSLTNLKLYERLEPANTVYPDGGNITGTVSGSGQHNTFVVEFLVP